jgi:hypothetical protein
MRQLVGEGALINAISSLGPPSSGADEPVPRMTFVNHSGVSSRASENASRASQSIADDASEERLLNIEKQLRTANDTGRLVTIERQLRTIAKALDAVNARLGMQVRPTLSRHGSI